MNITEKIKTLTTKDFANIEKDLGFGNGTIGKWKTSSPSVDKIEKIADYFNVSVDYLLGRKEYYLTEDEELMIYSFKNLSLDDQNFIKSEVIRLSNRYYHDENAVKLKESEHEKESLIYNYKNLSKINQAKLMKYLIELANDEQNSSYEEPQKAAFDGSEIGGRNPELNKFKTISELTDDNHN